MKFSFFFSDNSQLEYNFFFAPNIVLEKNSGFRPNHSTVTALIQMYDEWLENIDNGTLKGVIFLDIKKAFDSVNHDILITKMNKNFGIIGMEPNWFRSYLTNREQNALSTVSCHLKK